MSNDDVKPDIVSLSSSIPEFECDIDLPGVGIELEAKHLLVQLIESVNGLKAVTRQSRLLMKWCEDNPELLGVPGSERRKRVKWLVDRWKKSNSNYAATKRNITDAFAKQSSSSDMFSQEETTTKTSKAKVCKDTKKCNLMSKVATTKAASDELKTPPRVKKEATIKTKMASFGSPLHLFGGNGSKKGKQHRSRLWFCHHTYQS